MPTIEFQCLTNDGATVCGTLDVKNEEAAIECIRSWGYHPLVVKRRRKSSSGLSAKCSFGERVERVLCKPLFDWWLGRILRSLFGLAVGGRNRSPEVATSRKSTQRFVEMMLLQGVCDKASEIRISVRQETVHLPLPDGGTFSHLRPVIEVSATNNGKPIDWPTVDSPLAEEIVLCIEQLAGIEPEGAPAGRIDATVENTPIRASVHVETMPKGKTVILKLACE